MKDFKNDSSGALSRFAKDKRLRTVRTVKTEYVQPKPYTDRESNHNTDYGKPTARRKSFNPNFSSDNRPVFGDKPKSDYSGRRTSAQSRERSYGNNSAHGKERSYSNDSAFGHKSAGGHRNDREYGYNTDGSAYNGERRNIRQQKSYGKYPSKGKTAAAQPRTKAYPKYKAGQQTGEMRLNRFIAQSGLCSRREADSYITAGLVTVNGHIVTELGTKILPTDEVRFNNERVQGEQKVYLVLNKPKGYVTTLDDPHATKIVSDLVKNACTERIYPVGRLDKNSLGLLLFTNDGDLTKQLTHPSYLKKKIYQVRLDKPLTRTDMQKIADGITLEDGEIYADEISYVKDDKKEIGIEIHSGRNRIVRRIFEHLGYSVEKLDRVYYAGLTKKNLKRGAWRFLTKEEVTRLKSGMYD
ncbi:MAG: rRNA pseudouridine synthase [Alistipes sp.]|nr:rRNA pseudouridine synthase [Alistipes sp.]